MRTKGSTLEKAFTEGQAIATGNNYMAFNTAETCPCVRT
jgi:hypothetical protein